MNVAEFEYDLPNEQIALFPPQVRGEAKLLVIDREQSSITHTHYPSLPQFLRPGDLVVLNNTKVLPARLFPIDQAGNSRELVILEKHHDAATDRFEAIVRGKVSIGDIFKLDSHSLEVIAQSEGSVTIKTPLPIEELT